MIYLISDPHGGQRMEGIKNYLSICKQSDLLIILGDLGLEFEKTEENKNFTEYFLSLDINVAFIDGNHENFDFYNSFPEEEWCGGKIHRLSKNIVHLMRGNIFEIEGKKIFAMGGCKSSSKWKDMGLWYFGEEPTEEECAFAIDNLKKHGNEVDYVLTHKYEIEWLGKTRSEALFALCKYIDENVSFKHWYAGHWHRTIYKDDKHTIVDSVPIQLK